MRYQISKKCFDEINTFYQNVARKYKHTYSKELMHRNIDDAIDSMYEIERTLLRRKPSLSKWLGLYMANTDKWYFAYTIEKDRIIIVDACHAQNMHEDI
jgi:hypothetical protein